MGSIGVIMAFFGLQDFIARHGVERRIYTSGENKSQLDPFRAEDPDDVARFQALSDTIHTAFIDHVKTARQGKLAEDDRLFSGEFWTGTQARELGLIDGIGHIVPTMKDRYGDKVRFAVYGPKKSLFKRFGASLVGQALEAVEDRSLWARLGL